MDKKVKTSGQSVFSKEVTVTRSEKAPTSKEVGQRNDISPKMKRQLAEFYKGQEDQRNQRKNNVSRGNSYETENIARSNYEKDKRSGMSPNDLKVKYRKF